MSSFKLQNPGAQPTRLSRGAAPSSAACPPALRQVQSWVCLASSKEATFSSAGIQTDDTVPEGHKGLHEDLYGEGSSRAHAAADYEFRRGEDEGEAVLEVGPYLADRENEKPLGVFAIYDSSRVVQYISYSRNIVLSVKALLARLGDDRVAFVRAMVFANKVMATRSNLMREAENWLANEGTTPPGNGVCQDEWEGSQAHTATAMSPSEAAAYEEKKLKMRKAMGQNVHDDEMGEVEPSVAERRANMIKAMERDDWSGVIQEQTDATVSPQSEPEPETTPDGAVVSPFSRAPVHRAVGAGAGSDGTPMTVDSVDAALEEVRPYLIADGGNVEVVKVEDGHVFLKLQGACGTCASSTTTMKMGVERSLRAAFGDALKEVVQLDPFVNETTVEGMNEHLEMLRPAIQNYGGVVEVLSVEGGVCEVEYTGPKPISVGIRAALVDRFPDIKEVKFVGME